LAWNALDDPQKLARKQLEIGRLATAKLTVYELVNLRDRVLGGSLSAIAMEDVVRAVDPALCAGKTTPNFCFNRAKAFSEHLAELTRRCRQPDADLLGNSSPSVSLGSGPWVKKRRGKKTSKTSQQQEKIIGSPPRSPSKQASRNTPAKKHKPWKTPTKQQAASRLGVQISDMKSQLTCSKERHEKSTACIQKQQSALTEQRHQILHQQRQISDLEKEAIAARQGALTNELHAAQQDSLASDKQSSGKEAETLVPDQHSKLQQCVEKLSQEASAATKHATSLERRNVKLECDVLEHKQRSSKLKSSNDGLQTKSLEQESALQDLRRLLKQKISSLTSLEEREKARKQQVAHSVTADRRQQQRQQPPRAIARCAGTCFGRTTSCSAFLSALFFVSDLCNFHLFYKLQNDRTKHQTNCARTKTHCVLTEPPPPFPTN
jgi:hypothetical protein